MDLQVQDEGLTTFTWVARSKQKGNKMKKLGTLLALVILLSSCTGSFQLANKVYTFNRDIEDKWVEEFVFIGLSALQVYSVALVVDMVVLNTAEFWTGENPLSASKAPGSQERVKVDGQEALLTYLPDGRVKIESNDSVFLFERTDSGVVATSLDGETLYRAETNPDGTVSVYDDSGELIRTFDPMDWMLPIW